MEINYDILINLNLKKYNIEKINSLNFELCKECELCKIKEFLEYSRNIADQKVVEDEEVGFVYDNLDKIESKIKMKSIKKN